MPFCLQNVQSPRALFSPKRPKLTEERGEGVVSTRSRFVVVVGRLERQRSADVEPAATGSGARPRGRGGGHGRPGVAVALAGIGAARDAGPRQRVELGGVQPDHVAGADGDQLVRHQHHLLEAQLDRPEERLTDQRVVVQRP